MQCMRRLQDASANPTVGTTDLAIGLTRGTTVGTNAGLPTQEVIAGGDTAGMGVLASSGACPGTGGSATAGSRYELTHEYAHGQLARTHLVGFPNWYRADVDRNTGLPTATYNAQDQKTTHTFDILSRLTSSPSLSSAACNTATATSPASTMVGLASPKSKTRTVGVTTCWVGRACGRCGGLPVWIRGGMGRLDFSMRLIVHR